MSIYAFVEMVLLLMLLLMLLRLWRVFVCIYAKTEHNATIYPDKLEYVKLCTKRENSNQKCNYFFASIALFSFGMVCFLKNRFNSENRKRIKKLKHFEWKMRCNTITKCFINSGKSWIFRCYKLHENYSKHSVVGGLILLTNLHSYFKCSSIFSIWSIWPVKHRKTSKTILTNIYLKFPYDLTICIMSLITLLNRWSRRQRRKYRNDL